MDKINTTGSHVKSVDVEISAYSFLHDMKKQYRKEWGVPEDACRHLNDDNTYVWETYHSVYHNDIETHQHGPVTEFQWEVETHLESLIDALRDEKNYGDVPKRAGESKAT